MFIFSKYQSQISTKINYDSSTLHPTLLYNLINVIFKNDFVYLNLYVLEDGTLISLSCKSMCLGPCVSELKLRLAP